MFVQLLVVASYLQNLVTLPNYVDLSKSKANLDATYPKTPIFNAGVASGDPTQNSVILWTRIQNYIGNVNILVSKNNKFIDPIIHKSYTNALHDFIVKVDILNLSPNTQYYYKFTVNNKNTVLESMVGKTKTLALHTDHLKVAVASCNNYPYGHFTPYSVMVDLKVDLLIFLGDYIYEYGNGVYANGEDLDRIPSPNKDIMTLSEYRQRHLQYKQDVNLQVMHQNIPMIAVWDDHEFADNSWRNGSADYSYLFEQRKLAAMQAYFEYIPIRVFPDEMFKPIYRVFRIGNLFELIMLDTRSLRDKTDVHNPLMVGNKKRTLLGTVQQQWLLDLPPAYQCKWTLYGNQILFGVVHHPLHYLNIPLLADSWDGYPSNRKFMIQYIKQRHRMSGAMPLILSGDIHISMHNVINGINEFVTPAIASPNVEGKWLGRGVQYLFDKMTGFGDFKWANVQKKGFMVLDIHNDHVQTEWIHMMDVKLNLTSAYTVGKSIRIHHKNK